MKGDGSDRPHLRRGHQAPGAGRPLTRRLLILAPLLIALLGGGLLGLALAAVIHMPRVDQLADYTPGLITYLVDRDGKPFASYAREKRELLEEGEVPLLLQQAVLAAEDADFFQHGGIDVQGVLRAALRNLSAGRRAMGGSTITMQLARQLFLTPRKTWKRKIEEALLAVELEKRYSKQQILRLYCNQMFLGHGNYGMESAARYFFDRSAAELTLPQAAMLAGILQRPSSYSPYRRPDLVQSRRDYVLGRMLDEGYISQQQRDEAVAAPLEVRPRRRKSSLAPYFAEEVRIYLEGHYGSESLLEKGLQVETTLDREVQESLESAVRQGLRSLDRRRGWRGPAFRVEGPLDEHELPSWSTPDPDPEAWHQGVVLESGPRSARVRIGERTWELGPRGIAWTRRQRPDQLVKSGDVAWFSIARNAKDPEETWLELEQEPELEAAALVLESASGAVRGLVGGWDFERSKFNRATQASRQVGSAFKPFVWGAALENGYTAADTLFDSPTVYPGADQAMSYSPRNYYRGYYGIITLRRALEKSANVTAVKLLDLVGASQVIDFARRCGVESPLFPYPTLALGAADLKPIELAAGYAAIANQGIRMEPYLIERVALPDGRILEEAQPRAYKAMELEIAYLLTQLLEGVIDRGTAVSINDLEAHLAGKTGTTDRYTDAWFVGFNRRYTILVWVGYDTPRSIGRNMTGSEAALPIWRQIVESGLQRGWLIGDQPFVAPPNVVQVPVEYLTGLLPGPGAQWIIQEAFLRGTEPTRSYEPRWTRIMELPWYQQRPFYLPKAGERMPDDVEDWTPVQKAWEEKAESARG